MICYNNSINIRREDKSRVEYYCDGQRNVIRETDNLSRSAYYSYDGIGQVIYEFDSYGNIKVEYTAKGNFIGRKEYYYDKINRLTVMTEWDVTTKLLPSLIKCRKPLDENDDCGISRISFENFTIGGEVITNEKIVCKGNVKSIKINK